MHEGIGDIFDGVNIDTLYGISALGTRLCLYTVQRGSGILNPRQLSTIQFGSRTQILWAVGTSTSWIQKVRNECTKL